MKQEGSLVIFCQGGAKQDGGGAPTGVSEKKGWVSGGDRNHKAEVDRSILLLLI